MEDSGDVLGEEEVNTIEDYWGVFNKEAKI